MFKNVIENCVVLQFFGRNGSYKYKIIYLWLLVIIYIVMKYLKMYIIEIKRKQSFVLRIYFLFKLKYDIEIGCED